MSEEIRGRASAGLLQRLGQNQRGAVFAYLAFGIVVFMGAMALALDLGRFFTTNTELQSAADSLALAGAAELDGSLGARDRATLVVFGGLQGQLANGQTFATDGLGQEVEPNATPGGVVFLKRLPPDGTEPAAADVALTDAEARFIRVMVEDRTVNNGLSIPLIGNAPITTNAVAVAGFTQAVCRFPPLFMCNPMESTVFPVATPECEAMLGSGAPFDPNCLPHGVQVLMKFVGGGNAAWSPGNFGLLDPPTGNQGAMNVAEQLASASPNACFSSFVETRTGEAVGPVDAALNVRFDMYDNPGFSNKKGNPLYRPAINVTKGQKPVGTDPCKTELVLDQTVAMPMPRDDCFLTDSCAGGGRFGGGNWDRAAYWNINHPGGTPTPPDYNMMSRHDVYRYEIDNTMIPNNSPTGENGNASCYSGGTLSDPGMDADTTGTDEIDRRILTIAVLNCQALIEQGFDLNGNSQVPLPVERFAKIFLTEPAQGTGTDKADIWGEIVGVLDPGELDGILHDIVQLYR